MRDFEKIDCGVYNKPPYYQQWLTKDDTLKLVTLSDKSLCEIDKHLLSLIDQWDLDNAEGQFLDRIGKILSEQRNGRSDEDYRIILNLRKLLNTNSSTVPDIIKAIKYLYSSEIVHIVPDYPAGLIIEHDGEGTPGLNFNRLLAEVVSAGVSFSTKELFIFTEEFDVTDSLIIILRKITRDSFQNGLKYDGRGKYDGHTLNDIKIKIIKHDGTFQYNGLIKYNRITETEPDTHVLIPFKHSNGIRDEFTAYIPQTFTDQARSITKYNGAAKHNGIKDYSGFGENSAYDISTSKIKAVLSDSEVTADNLSVQINKSIDDRFTTRYRYDGYFDFSGKIKHEAANDALSSVEGEARTISDSVLFGDDFFIGKRFLRKFNNAYKYDGEINHNGNVLIPV